MSDHGQLYDTVEDCAWLRETALRGYVDSLPPFASFTIAGNEDCPLEIRLYTDANPHYRAAPVREYRLADAGLHNNLSQYYHVGPIDPFTRGYLEAALWTEDPDPGSGEWAEHDGWEIAAIAPESLERAIKVCREFQAAHRADLDAATEASGRDDASHGHDFWLTRNGHGAGFWDRGYGELGERLTAACKPYGECYVSGPERNDQGGADPEAIAAWDGVIWIEGQ